MDDIQHGIRLVLDFRDQVGGGNINENAEPKDYGQENHGIVLFDLFMTVSQLFVLTARDALHRISGMPRVSHGR